jgi:hypothetical protein
VAFGFRISPERWWLEVTGKGDKTRQAPATNELMVELARYRREQGLSPLPIPGESMPLVLPIGGKKRALTRAAIHSIVKQVFRHASDRVRQRGADFAGLADLLERASTWSASPGSRFAAGRLWMEHCGGNLVADGAPASLSIDVSHLQRAKTTQGLLHSQLSRRFIMLIAIAVSATMFALGYPFAEKRH